MKTSTRIWMVHLLILMFVGTAVSQTSGGLEKARADLAVPDAPAFKILEADPSNIMRPGNLREVGFAVSNFLLSKGTLPQAYAMELSPGLLLSDVSLSKYQKNPFWYRFRLSVATTSGQNGGTDLAVGLRFTFVDETDLRTDTVLQRTILNAARALNDIEVNALKRLPADYPFLSDSLRAVADKDYDDFKATQQALVAGYDAAIVRSRDEAKKKAWNKSIVELGLAIVGSSKDSLAKNLLASRLGLWATGGFALFGAHDQTLIGMKASLGRDAAGALKQAEGSVALRSYYGENTGKGFLEADWTLKKAEAPAYLVSAGGELDLANGIWVEATLGLVKRGAEDPKISTSFNIKVATPESK